MVKSITWSDSIVDAVNTESEELANTNTNVTTNTNAIALKADKTYVDTQLATKANQSDLNATNTNVGTNSFNINTLYSAYFTFSSPYAFSLNGLTIGNFILPPFLVSLGNITLG